MTRILILTAAFVAGWFTCLIQGLLAGHGFGKSKILSPDKDFDEFMAEAPSFGFQEDDDAESCTASYRRWLNNLD